MLAPIAPAVAEEAWHLLITSTRTERYRLKEHAPTIFATGFPVAHLDELPLINPMQKCIVQIDGKRKFETEIRQYPYSVTDRNDGLPPHEMGLPRAFNHQAWQRVAR